MSAVAVTEGEHPCFGFAIRSVGRRLRDDDAAGAAPGRDLPRSVEQLTELVGRVSLKEIVRESTDLIERLCIEAALAYTDDNRASAAEILGLSPPEPLFEAPPPRPRQPRRGRGMTAVPVARCAASPAPAAVLELMKPVTWFPPMWAFMCGVVSSGVPVAGRWPFLIAGVVLTGPLVCGTSQVVNDWFDRHVDAINQPERPIPSGRIPGRWGLGLAVDGDGRVDRSSRRCRDVGVPRDAARSRRRLGV